MNVEKVMAMASKHVVRIESFAYQPERLEIAAGDEVVWRNADAMAHTATRTQDPQFDTGTIKPGETSSPVTFGDGYDVSEVSYFCRPHPFMTGTILIKS
jgi:plastocyanin